MQSAACVISIIIDMPDVVAYVNCCCLSCTLKQIDLTSIFVTAAALLCQHGIVF